MKSKVQHLLVLEFNIIIWVRLQMYKDINKIYLYSLKLMNRIAENWDYLEWL